MLLRPRGRTELENEDQRRYTYINGRLSCYLVWDWFQEQQLVFSVCVPRYSLCPLTNEREVEVDIPINLIDLSELIRGRGGEAFTFFPVIGCLTK